MLSFKRSFRTYYSFFILLIICFLFLFFEIKNGRFWMSDFNVYYKAAERLLNGITLYRHPEDLHYIFKYSPASAVLFIPFLLFPFSAAKVIFWIFLSFSVAFGMWLFLELIEKDIFRENAPKANRIVLISLFVLALHFLRELHLGQVNHLLLVLFIVMLFFYSRKNYLITGLIFSITIFFKPFALIFIPYFIFRRNWKLLFNSLIFTVILFFVPLAFSWSWEYFTSENNAWLNEIKIEMGAKQDLLQPGNLTIFSFFTRYTPFYFLIKSGFNTFLFQLIILLGMALFYLYLFIKSKEINNYANLDFGILICTIPLLAFTSANAFGFAEPLVLLTLYFWKSFKLHEKIIAVVSFTMIGGNFSEIIGRDLSAILDNLSVITFGAILLIVLAGILRVRKTA